ncbi:MAG: IS200/IS605 family transposase [Thermoplasmata archaeon]
MPYELDKGAHSVYSLYYHFIQVVKYRKKVFTNDVVVDLLKTKIREIAETFNVEVLNIECDTDHFHMLFKSTLLLKIPQFVNAIKTIISREIQRKFPEVKKDLWEGKFWSPSYFLATSGQVTLAVLKNYVDSQEVKGNENL